TCCRFSPRKWISSLAWRNAAIPFRLNFSASCTLIIHPQHACILQAHLVLETDPSFRLILYWKRLGIDSFAKRCDCIDSIERIGNLGFKNGSFCQSVVVFDPDSAVAGRTVSGTDSAGTYYSGIRSTRNQRMM